MPATTATTATLLLLPLLAAPAAAINFLQYKTESVKGAACGAENKSVGPFYIPEGQCTGVLYDLARHCGRLQLVKVEVTDYAYARVHIEDSLTSASVERAPAAGAGARCPGRAVVRAVLGCSVHSSEVAPRLGAPGGAPLAPLAPRALPPE